METKHKNKTQSLYKMYFLIEMMFCHFEAQTRKK